MSIEQPRRVLSIPDFGDEDLDLLGAMLRYASEGGWYVGPLALKDKNPGAMLGGRWQAHSRRDSDGIGVWYLLDDAGGGFLHCGRSGAIVFDVDHPERVPAVLAKYLWLNPDDPVAERLPAVPFQATRADEPGRGHYLFLQPDDRMLGNGAGGLGDDWGEVRGKNGVIVVWPSVHESAEDGAAYRWVRTGTLPPLPDEIRDLLPNADRDVDAAPDDLVRAFLDTFEFNDRPAFRDAPFERWHQSMAAGASRHQTCLKVLCWIVRDAGQRLYPARPAVKELYDLFTAAMETRPTRGRFPRAEFQSMLAYAVGDALALDLDARRDALEQRLAARDAEKGIRQVTDEERQQHAATAQQTVLDTGPVSFDPDRYFWDKSIGLDVTLLAKDVLEIGPLAKGVDGITWLYREGVWRLAKDVIEQRAVALLGRRYRNSHVSNVTAVIRAQIPVITCEPLHAFLNTRSGMVDWETGAVRPHDPSYMSTVQFPWAWNADVVDGSECPRFDKFLSDTLTPDYVTLAWQMIGYLLYSGNPRQIAFLLYGSGNNGKGTLMRVLSALLGGENYATETLTQLNTNKFASINLYGMIANLAGDIDAKYQEETAMFKTLTGEDMVSGERKFGDRVKFSCWAVPVFSANKIPGSADTSKGYTRRWKVLRFEREFTDAEVIPGYSDMLIEELPGIAAKAVHYLRDVIANGFKNDGEIATGQAEFERDIDQVRQWVDECTEPAATGMEERSMAYKSYRLWADATGVHRLKAQEFYARLAAAGFAPAKVHGGRRVHRGLIVTQFRVQGAMTEHGVLQSSDEPDDPFGGSVERERRADA